MMKPYPSLTTKHVMSVDVIIVHYRDLLSLTECFEALCKQTQQPDTVFVIDNSNDLKTIKSDLNLKILKPSSNLGFAKACNYAASLSSSEWLAFLNPDAFPEKNWLEALSSCAQKRGALYLTSKQILYSDSNLLDGVGDSYAISGLYRRRGYLKPSSTSYPKEVFSACGAAMFIQRQLFQKVEGFDERFYAYGEDVDLGFRLKLLNQDCYYCENAVVHHKGYSSSGGRHSDFSLYYGHRNLLWVYIKNMPLPFLILTLPLHIAITLVSIVLFTLQGKGRVILKSKRDALKGLPEMLRARRVIQKTKNCWTSDAMESL